MSYCSRCGAKLPDDESQYCHMCGAPVVSPAIVMSHGETPQSAGLTQQPPEKTKMHPVAIVGIVVGVFLLLAVLAAIAIPTFLGQRALAEDNNAKSLLRNSMTVIEAAYADARTFAPEVLTAEVLEEIEPTIDFILVGDIAAATDATADAGSNSVAYFGTQDTYAVGTMSPSSKSFGVFVDRSDGVRRNEFYVDGQIEEW